MHALSAEETLRCIHQIELDGDSGALEAAVVGDELRPFSTILSDNVDGESFVEYLDGRLSEELEIGIKLDIK